jgi:tRNA threonylcarbamoyladenosine biosynthesis protein TsaE
METTMPDTLEWLSHGEAHTVAFGRRLGALLEAGDLVLLLGSFGMGKTHLTKGIAAGLGADPDDVNSPSFVLVNEYAGDAAHGHIPIYHADLYRIDTTHALSTIGLEQYLLGDGVCIIEWAERALPWLPDEHLVVEFAELAPNTRRLRIVAHGARPAAILDSLRRNLPHDAGLLAQSTYDERYAAGD